VRGRPALALVITLACATCATSSVYGADDTPAGAGLNLRLTPLTKGVAPNGRFVTRFSMNYSGPGRSGDIFLTFVAVDGHARKLTPTVQAPGVRFRKPYTPGATSFLVRGVNSAGTRVVRATFALRADGKICVRNARAWLIENPSDYRARTGTFCNYAKAR
jgi:hypothetical protein